MVVNVAAPAVVRSSKGVEWVEAQPARDSGWYGNPSVANGAARQLASPEVAC